MVLLLKYWKESQTEGDSKEETEVQNRAEMHMSIREQKLGAWYAVNRIAFRSIPDRVRW